MATTITRVPVVRDEEHDEWYITTSARDTKLSLIEKRQFRRELRQAGLLGPGDKPLDFQFFVDKERVALIQFHNRLVRHATSRQDRLDYLNKQQEVLQTLADNLSNNEDLGAGELILDKIRECMDWHVGMFELVENVRNLM
ncbi:hypothetical protein BHE90_010125 [Fusarium euwallaceae]|uniref:Uncharacterized protein n=1 Tax=Fusarium euwallaceae TaxID=1147111 RepID=A0A430LI99_9HYPO|nr:hypothetical protein BHE90_010125 [Fusarium euwallaceae]